NAQSIPDTLRPWIPWVLYGHEDETCPSLADHPETHRCAWPTYLELDLRNNGGNFRSQWRIFRESWIPLPGDQSVWPQGLEVNGKPAPASAQGSAPGVRLLPGTHVVGGRLAWPELPETLSIPGEIGLIRLKIGGHPVPFPGFDGPGRLWLHGTATPSDQNAAAVKLSVSRLLRDAIPVEAVTRLELDVAGAEREILLTGALLSEFTPLALNSPLPARIEPDRRLRLQLRPGHWEISLTSRANRNLEALALPAFPSPWPSEELWSFAADRAIRVVELAGAPLVDPRQTRLPDEYMALPTYAMTPGTTLHFTTAQRGDPEPEPDALRIHRTLWLDFSGQGMTFLDGISGRMTRNWRLDSAPGLTLGRVTLDGQAQSITRLDDSPGGVEVRRGDVHLSAESRWESDVSRLPVTGWNADFVSASSELRLPPGWRLFAAPGADQAPDSWLGQWSLLDLFLALVTALAASRLRGWAAGGLMLLLLALSWHEPNAPQGIWLWWLGAEALSRVMPPGNFASALRIARTFVLAALAIQAIPFAVQQLRLSLYPQFEPRAAAFDYAEQEEAVTASAPAAATQVLREATDLRAKAARAEPSDLNRSIDPDALTQTGPGLPQWQWHSVKLNWNGPVLRDQTLRLLLIPPSLNRALNLLRVALLAAVILLLLGWRRVPGTSGLLVLPLLLLGTPDSRAGDFPPPALLEELRSHLLEKPACGEECAQIERMNLRVRTVELQIVLIAHVESPISLPLPAQPAQWTPSRVLVDGAPAAGPYADSAGVLWLALDTGVHSIEMAGPLPALPQIGLPLPLKPHRVDVDSEGWDVMGVGEDGIPESMLQLQRRGQNGAAKHELESSPLPAFVSVERTLRLGLDWQAVTRVTRLSPPDAPITLEIPLLPGESVISPQFSAENGSVRIHLPPGTLSTSWDSTLEKTSTFEFRATQTGDWTEIWRLDAAPIWHVQTRGIPAAHHQDASGNWLPEWHPWPGETVTLLISRPAAAPGNALTIESSALEIRPGLRATDAELAVNLLSAKGGQHELTLPGDAELQSVSIDGVDQPIRQNGSTVKVPVHPGEQTIRLAWRSRTAAGSLISAPEVDLGAPSVNSRIGIELGQNRWVLLVGGPVLGPSVAFWGMLGVIVLLAVSLGKWLPEPPLKTRHWLLLLIGLSQAPLPAGLAVIGWIVALARRRDGIPAQTRRFNLIQVGLALLTALALSVLLSAVHQGLLGLPDMRIAGYESSALRLQWYTDRSGTALPRPWVVSVPLYVYRLLMLAWALWLAYALLDWLRWGWECFSAGGLWRQDAAKTPASKAPPSAAEAPEDPWQN
ncbi:MAG: hypothetical protein PHT19_01510, partial [Methylococcus sp.]|nr:hypothetical protein [Methylococcus sp.]